MSALSNGESLARAQCRVGVVGNSGATAWHLCSCWSLPPDDFARCCLLRWSFHRVYPAPVLVWLHSITARPERTTVYTTLVGLMNATDESLGKEVNSRLLPPSYRHALLLCTPPPPPPPHTHTTHHIVHAPPPLLFSLVFFICWASRACHRSVLPGADGQLDR